MDQRTYRELVAQNERFGRNSTRGLWIALALFAMAITILYITAPH